MIRLGIHLGCPPEVGGTFQYAHTVLSAMASLPEDRYDLVATHTHPAWSGTLASFGSRFQALQIHRGVINKAHGLNALLGMPERPWRSVARFLPTVERELCRLACDWWIFPSQDYLASSTPVPSIGTIHDLMHRYESRFPEVGARGIVRRRERLYRNMCRCAKVVLVDSECGKQQVIESYGMAAKRVHVLPFAAPRYITDSIVPDDFDAHYHLPDSYVFYPAQVWQHKNHARLIKALAKVRQTLPDLHLVLAGSDKNASTGIHELVHALELDEVVHFLGYVPNDCMGELYRRARCLVMPSFFGPTNIPPLEAMQVGCPMALADVYAMREQSGDAALYFNPESVDEIAASILTLVADAGVRARLRTACAQRLGRFTQDAFNARFRDMIHKVAPVADMTPQSVAKEETT